MSAEAVFNTAVLDFLKDQDSVKAIFGDPPRLHDRAPGGIAFPFLTVGRGETTPLDADATGLFDHRLTLHVWGRRDDRDAIRDALGTIRGLLHHADLSLNSPWRCVVCRVVYTDFFTAPDGRTLHGVIRVRAHLEEQET